MKSTRHHITLLLTLVGGVLLALQDPLFNADAVTVPQPARVTGRIELLNSKIKSRNGKPDAGGVVVWLEPLDGNALHGPRAKQKIIQRGKRFSPHVIAVERGTEIDFPNLDPFFHNVFSLFDGKRFDLGLYASGESRPVLFNRAGISFIFCNIHPQMSAIVVAVDTPFFAVSDQNGNVTINDVPEGRYQVKVWHERTGDQELQAQSRTVRVSGQSFDLGALRLSEAGYMPRPHSDKHGQSYENERNKPAYKHP